MMANDYPPMDKEALTSLLEMVYWGWCTCPWGCETTTGEYEEDHYHTVNGRFHRMCFTCPTCKRLWTHYQWFTGPMGNSTGHVEVHAGWPPDVHIHDAHPVRR